MVSSGNGGEVGLQFSRIFDAPPELVFECFTQPEHLSHFWAPAGASAPAGRIRVDLRPGGTFATLIVNDTSGATYATDAVFLDVDRPSRLVWYERHTGMTVRVTFTALPSGKTLFRLHQTNVPDQVRLPENQAGFKTTFEKFANYLSQLTHGEEHEHEHHDVR